MILLQAYWKQLAGAALLVIVFGGGYYNGYQHEKIKFDNFKLQVDAVAKVAESHTKEVVQNQKTISEDITRSYANAVTNLNDYYAKHPVIKRVQDTPASSSTVPKIPYTTTSTNDTTESTSIDSAGITLDCAQDVLQLLSLQKWIVEQKGNN